VPNKLGIYEMLCCGCMGWYMSDVLQTKPVPTLQFAQQIMAFKKLVRFLDSDGSVNFGDAGDRQVVVGAEVEVLSGDIDAGFQKNGQTKRIQKVRMCPVCRQNLPYLRFRSCYAHFKAFRL
jgi:hypothetical protein